MKEVLRMCIVCREMKNKKDLIRLVKSGEKNVTVDESGKLNCRGAYVCNNDACLEKLEKTKALSRAFKMQIENETYENIRSFNGRK